MSGYENRFAEVQRKSREARAKLDANQQARAAADERKAAAVREPREQPDPAYSEWDSTPRAVAARQLEPNVGTKHGTNPETKSARNHASSPETEHESADPEEE